MVEAYHHGNLRAALIERALEVIADEGPYELSLRSLAADLGVSHTAPRHHFGSRAGVLGAIAEEGFDRLSAAMRGVREAGGSFLDVGVAYVEFAVAHPAHFGVMFAPSLWSPDEPGLRRARQEAFAELGSGVNEMAAEETAAAIIAGWSLVHGLATLTLTGNLDASKLGSLVAGGDVLDIARRAAGMLYGSQGWTT